MVKERLLYNICIIATTKFPSEAGRYKRMDARNMSIQIPANVYMQRRDTGKSLLEKTGKLQSILESLTGKSSNMLIMKSLSSDLNRWVVALLRITSLFSCWKINLEHKNVRLYYVYRPFGRDMLDVQDVIMRLRGLESLLLELNLAISNKTEARYQKAF